MATLNKVKRGQTVTEQIDLINENVENVNTELVQLNYDVTNNTAGYITSEEAPVQSVNTQTGSVVLSANDVGAFPNSTTVQTLDINNTKNTGVYIGTSVGNPVYLLVIKYSDSNIYQELIGSNYKKYRRFTSSWSEWVQDYSSEHPVTASDVTGINIVDTNTNLDLALLNSGTFVKADIKYNPSTNKLYFGNEEFATKTYVDNAVNMIHSIIVNELPSTGVENTIYFVPSSDPTTGNAFEEYVYVNSAWEIVGSTSVDLTPFLTKTEASETYATKTENDGKVSKTTTVNGYALSSNITLTAQDVGALPSDTPLAEDVVNKYNNTTIASMLTDGDFSNGDVFIAIDDGTYKIGHIYEYNNGIVDITKPDDYVDLTNDQSIGGTKNYTGILRYGGVSVATLDDIDDKLDKVVTATTNKQVYVKQADGTQAMVDAVNVKNQIGSEKVPLYDSNGNILSNAPTTDDALATKKYIDDIDDSLQTSISLKASTSYVDDMVTALTGSSAPTTSTQADFVGQLYLDTTNNNTYQCVAITTADNTTSYTWTKIIRSTDVAGTNLGVVKLANNNYGIAKESDGQLRTVPANNTEISNKNYEYKPITTTHLDHAVKVGITTNTTTLTDVEKEAAQNWIGVSRGIARLS